jgi:hypothetical protein
MKKHIEKIAEHLEYCNHYVNSLDYLHFQETLCQSSELEEKGHYIAAIDALIFNLKHRFTEMDSKLDVIKAKL